MIRSTDIDKTLAQRERAEQSRRDAARRYAEKYAARRRAQVQVARTAVRRTPVNRESAKRRVEAAIYRVRRKAFLTANPWCQFPLGCSAAATTIQHRGGRVGDRYLDESLWAASCWHHNGWAEDNPVESKRVGWSLPRVGRLPEDNKEDVA